MAKLKIKDKTMIDKLICTYKKYNIYLGKHRMYWALTSHGIVRANTLKGIKRILKDSWYKVF